MINILSLGKLVFADPVNYVSQQKRKHNAQLSVNNHANRLMLKKQIISQYCDYFNDLDSVTEITCESDNQRVDSRQVHYCVAIRFDKNTTRYVCVSIGKLLLSKLDESVNPDLSSALDDDASENFAQLLHNLNYSVCRRARRRGYNLKHGAVQNYLPHCDQSVLAHCYIQ